MKQLIALVCTLFYFGFSAMAQSITNEKMNIVYRGIGNPITVGIPDYPCKSLNVEVDNGDLQKIGETGCQFIYSPQLGDTVKLVHFSVYVKNKEQRKRVLVSRYRIKDLPNPEASISNKRDTVISLTLLQKQQGMIATLKGFDLEARYEVTSFNYAVIKDEHVINTGKNLTNKFDERIKTVFAALEYNDIILFYNIYCKRPDKKSCKLESFELKVIQ